MEAGQALVEVEGAHARTRLPVVQHMLLILLPCLPLPMHAAVQMYDDSEAQEDGGSEGEGGSEEEEEGEDDDEGEVGETQH